MQGFDTGMAYMYAKPTSYGFMQFVLRHAS